VSLEELEKLGKELHLDKKYDAKHKTNFIIDQLSSVFAAFIHILL
jgi:hypothetical protein